jgi:tripartite motif-containing protein 71
MKLQRICIGAVAALSLVVIGAQALERKSFLATVAESYASDLIFGSNGALPDEMAYPEGVAVDAAGNIWVSDTNNSRITKFNAAGDPVLSIGGNGSADGQFSYQKGLAIDTQRNVLWVADSGNNRVQKFDLTGRFLCKNATLSQPQGVAVRLSNGYAYVANTAAHAVARLTPACALSGGWGGSGFNDGEFSSPIDVAVDATGNVFVTDSGNHRVQKFSAAGAFLAKFGANGGGDSRFTATPQFNGLGGIEVDGAGDLFVVDQGNNRIQKLHGDGSFVTSFAWSGSGKGQLSTPTGIAVDARGRVYVAERYNHRVQRFSPSASAVSQLFKSKWGAGGNTNGLFNYPTGIATDPGTGNVYVADTNNSRIQVFTASGAYVSQWGASGAGNGQFSTPGWVAVDTATDVVYVSEVNGHRVQKFTLTGAYLGQWGGYGTANGQFYSPQGLAVDPVTHDVYVVDGNNQRVQRFTSDGVFVRGIGNGTTWAAGTAAPTPVSGNGNGSFSYPSGAYVNAAGQLFVTDGHRVQRFGSDGVFQAKWGGYGTGKGQLVTPYGITGDADGNIYVAEQGSYRLSKFRSDGRFVSTWGSYGTAGDGLMYGPTGIALGANGFFIYVVDRVNQRVQRFEQFGFTAAVAPATRTIVQGGATTFTLTLSGVGPNTFAQMATFAVIGGLPKDTTAVFSPTTVKPVSTGTVSTTLTLDTAATTPARTYTVAVQALAGGQTRVKTVTLTVNPP